MTCPACDENCTGAQLEEVDPKRVRWPAGRKDAKPVVCVCPECGMIYYYISCPRGDAIINAQEYEQTIYSAKKGGTPQEEVPEILIKYCNSILTKEEIN